MINLELVNISKVFSSSKHKVQALKNINLKFTKDIVVTICGSSGCGKTTLLNIIGGVTKPTSGEIILNKKKYTDLTNKELSDLRFINIGYIFQNNFLINNLSVVDNIMLGLNVGAKNLQLPKSEIQKKVNDIIKLVGLTNWKEHKIYELSGGQAQRVAIARAVVKNPKLILADEPTANLDIENSKLVLDLIKEINERYHSLCLISTHDNYLLENSDNIVKIKDGIIGEPLCF